MHKLGIFPIGAKRVHPSFAVAAAMAVAVLGSACTQIVGQNAEDVSTHWYPGLAVVRVQPSPSNGTVINTRGAGVILSRNTLTLGWQDEQILALPDATTCRVIIIVKAPQEIGPILSNFQISESNISKICQFRRQQRD